MTTTVYSKTATQSAIQVNGVDKVLINETTGAEIKGTTTNNSAAAGMVGEYIEAQRLGTSPIPMTSAASAEITSIPLTAGDWDVQGQFGSITTGTTTVNYIAGHIDTSISVVDGNRLGITRENYGGSAINTIANGSPVLNTGVTRISLSAPATVYLVGNAGFGTSTLTMFGRIHARRVR